MVPRRQLLCQLVVLSVHLRMQAAAALAWTTLHVGDSTDIEILQPATGEVLAAGYLVQLNCYELT